MCGSGLGTFIFSPLINYLVEEYGWRGCMLLISAICLHCIFFGAMFRPLEYETKPKRRESQVKYTKENGCVLKTIEKNNGIVKTTSEKNGINGSHNDLEDGTNLMTKSENNINKNVSLGQFSLSRSLKLPMEKNGNIPNSKLKNEQMSRLALSTPLLAPMPSGSEPFRPR